MEKNRAPPPVKKVPGDRVNLVDLPPERIRAVLRAMQNLRNRIGNAIIKANPGLDKNH